MNETTETLARRRRTTKAERRQWAQKYFQSGLTQREFAVREGLGLSTLQHWVAKNPVACNERRPTPAGAAFAEVKLCSPGVARWAVEAVRADGVVVRLAHDAPLELVKQVLPAC